MSPFVFPRFRALRVARAPIGFLFKKPSNASPRFYRIVTSSSTPIDPTIDAFREHVR
jgi:hypothetical protein